ncbi:DUF4097 family beta strand repeat-containing protein [Klenkia taihuensis]|uniref:Putative adhesin n=1 Tax=Klenkia taihuensis TaxID=1225127 RepID=A0A1I1VAI6_9ACTN|nr:DUF4097 family beta strand repeat-containing protein [Klenkia taihuensis]GHE14414.1 hypothetical protein GCM10011381_40820 [Klenkia taihuensis]SFD79909.1 Putative adhesin [Klenkia taihuensis]
MTVRRETFAVTGPAPAVEVRNPAGSVLLTAVEGAVEITVDVEALNGAAERALDEVVVQHLPGSADGAPARLLVSVPASRLLSSPRFAVTAVLPAGCPLGLAVASAGATVRGPWGDVDVAGASGDVRVEACAGLAVRTASADVHVGTVTGDAAVRSASGDVRLDAVSGSVTVTTASGDVRLGPVGGDVEVTSASADVVVGRVASGEVALRTVSGDATVAVAPGLRLWLDLQTVSGRLDSQLAPDDDGAGDGAAVLTVRMRSVSGDLRLRRAG